MSELMVKLDEKVLPKNIITDINGFIEVVVNTILNGINNGSIKYSSDSITCEKCGKTIMEYTLSITPSIKILFIWKPTIIVKMAYDPTCGLNYFRIKF